MIDEVRYLLYLPYLPDVIGTPRKKYLGSYL